MSDQPNDIAAECEKRMDKWYAPTATIISDLRRYAAHMRQQQAEIEKLRGLVREMEAMR